MPGMKKKATPSPKPTATKKATPSPKSTLGPLPKNPTLNDYLARGLRPPKAPGQKKLPSDADVILKGYNDKKTINESKKKPEAKMSRQFGTTGKTLKDLKQMNFDKMAKAKKK